MARELQVYGWTSFVHGCSGGRSYSQSRMIVAAYSFAEVQRCAVAAGVDKPRRDYCSRTSNRTELDVALAHPGTVFGSDGLGWPRDYWRIEGGRLLRRDD